jgi:hypothetical protein
MKWMKWLKFGMGVYIVWFAVVLIIIGLAVYVYFHPFWLFG